MKLLWDLERRLIESYNLFLDLELIIGESRLFPSIFRGFVVRISRKRVVERDVEVFTCLFGHGSTLLRISRAVLRGSREGFFARSPGLAPSLALEKALFVLFFFECGVGVCVYGVWDARVFFFLLEPQASAV